MTQPTHKDLTEITRDAVVTYFGSSGRPPADVDRIATSIRECLMEEEPKVAAADELDGGFESLSIRPGGVGSGASLKAGNVILDWKKLLVEGSESLFAIVGATAMPWLIPFVGLVVLNRVHSLLKVEISERHAAVVWTMWSHAGAQRVFEPDELLTLVNQEVVTFDRPIFSEQELETVLTELEKMRCIEKADAGAWRLREKVVIRN